MEGPPGIFVVVNARCVVACVVVACVVVVVVVVVVVGTRLLALLAIVFPVRTPLSVLPVRISVKLLSTARDMIRLASAVSGSSEPVLVFSTDFWKRIEVHLNNNVSLKYF